MTAAEEVSIIVDHLSDKAWRMRNLYKIKPKDDPDLPPVIEFVPNAVQEKIMQARHKRKVIPKSRQHGACPLC